MQQSPTKLVLVTFNIKFDGDNKLLFDEIKINSYWLRGIGHEEKKISRIILCLYYCGFIDLAKQLQQLSIQALTRYGYKTGKDTNETITFWEQLLEKKETY